MAPTSSPSPGQLAEQLRAFAQDPATTDTSGRDALLKQCFGMLVPTSSTSGSSARPTSLPPSHWFCNQAPLAVPESATFLIRLHAYNSPGVPVWKQACAKVLHSCVNCNVAYQDAKMASRTSYLSDYPQQTLDNFFTSVNDWELRLVLDALKNTPPSATGPTALPIPIIYHILLNPILLKHSALIPLITAAPLSPSSLLIPPAGLLLLAVDVNPKDRAWAKQSLSCFSSSDSTKLAESHNQIFAAVVRRLAAQEIASDTECLLPTSLPHAPLWNHFHTILRIFIPQLPQIKGIDLARVVTGHLSDNDEHFSGVLQCFIEILGVLKSSTWSKDVTEYPDVIFASIKDNPMMRNILSEVTEATPWAFNWIEPYLHSIWNLPSFVDLLPKVFVYLGEELQHAAYTPNTSAHATTVLFKIIHGLLEKARAAKSHSHLRSLRKVCDTHAEIIAHAAFGKGSLGDTWQSARIAARELLAQIFRRDAEATLECLHGLCHFRDERTAKKKSSSSSTTPFSSSIPIPVAIHVQLWKHTYRIMAKNDAEGTAFLVTALARTAHLDLLRSASDRLPEDAFSSRFLKQDTDLCARFDACVKSVNHALKEMGRGLADQAESFAESSGGALLHEFLQQPDVVESVMHLMLSPIETLNGAGKIIALNAYDTAERSACYAAFFENHPSASFRGVTSYLRLFNEHAAISPDACGVSKFLVRNFTQILSGLCDSSGLLLRDDYGQKDGLNKSVWLPRLWKLMTESLALIFKRVKIWAPFYPNEEMVIWMRDALIFGRDMIAEVRVLQTAAGEGNETAITGQSSSDNRMINELVPILPQLIEWLKLTDKETLHQAHELLKTLLGCFASAHIQPSPTSIDILERYAERRKGTKTQLDDEKLTELLRAISPWVENDVAPAEDDDNLDKLSFPVSSDDDEIKFIGETKAKKQKQSHLDSWMKAKPAQSTKTSLKKHILVKPEPSAKKSFVQTTTNKSKTRTSATKAAYKPRPGDEPSSLAIQNYKRLQEPKNEGSSSKSNVILSAPPVKSDSSAASSSSDDDDDAALARLQKRRISPPRQVERRQVKMLPQPLGSRPIPNRLSRQEEARLNVLRLKPDLQPFHRQILEWDYDHNGENPPNTDPQLRKVPDYFSPSREFEEYRQVFEPLILMETWSQLVKAKEETIPVFIAEIVARRHTDNWLDLDITIVEKLPEKWRLGDTDIVLLRQVEGKKSLLAKVTASRRDRNGVHAGIRCSILTEALMPLDPLLHIHSKWELSRVLSLSTVHREYAALKGLPYYDLFKDIVNPQTAALSPVSPERIRSTMATYGVNEPQAIAIVSSLQSQGFSLIQGPPGTGKTSTIVGLVGAFLAARPRPVTSIRPGKAPRPEDREPPKKVLICAPSNAAIDEVAKRLKEGVRSADGTIFVPNIVRIGGDESINVAVKDISLDELVAIKLGNDPSIKNQSELANISDIRAKLETIREQLRAKHEELASLPGNSSSASKLGEDIRKLKAERVIMGQKLDNAKDANTAINRNNDSRIRQFRAQVLHEADVICSTLSGSGHDSLSPFTFETVIIDEAAQSIELSSLIPLKYRCTQCIMVGDPQQLAPTVLSSTATNKGYNQSLFVRIQKRRPNAVHLLSIQYRMHPEISVLPSKLFYDGRLADGDGMAAKRVMPWHSSPLFKPYQFFNVVDGREEKAFQGHSQINRAEIKAAIALYERIRRDYSLKVDLDYRIGVVTMYRAQMLELKKQFSNSFSPDILKKVDFNTVDGFQGQEKDIIILSCVRAGPGVQSVGFLADTRRMNVAFTRARASLFILGHAPTLHRANDIWSQIVDDARERNHLVDINLSVTRTLPMTASTAMPEVAPSVTKSHKPLKNVNPIVPPEPEPPSPAMPMFTPQQIKQSSHARPISGLPSSHPFASSIASADSSSIVSAPPLQSEMASSSTQVHAPPPALPPVPIPLPAPNRPPRPPPKKAAPSLFIPKKPQNKRPMPDGAAGPNKKPRPT